MFKRKKKTEKENPTISVKVKFKNTYIGQYGRYFRGSVYELPRELFDVFKNDVVELKG
jgi:hypothetical protein